MKVTFTPFVIDALGTVTEVLLKGLDNLEIRARVETIQTPKFFRSARIMRRVQKNWGHLLSLKLL